MCAVRGCRSARVKNNKDIRFHRFPKDEELKQKWIALCGMPRNCSGYICSLHFESTAFERNLKYELLGLPVPPACIRFKQGAVPTLHLPNKEGQCMSSVIVNRHPKIMRTLLQAATGYSSGARILDCCP